MKSPGVQSLFDLCPVLALAGSQPTSVNKMNASRLLKIFNTLQLESSKAAQPPTSHKLRASVNIVLFFSPLLSTSQTKNMSGEEIQTRYIYIYTYIYIYISIYIYIYIHIYLYISI